MTAAWTSELIDSLRASALAAGFELSGVASASEANAAGERFSAWLDAGYAGEMNYLARRNEEGELLRRSARHAMPWAQSVVVCALNYNLGGSAGTPPRSLDPAPSGSGWIAKYAWTGDANGAPLDYHDDLLRRLRQVEAALQQQAKCETRCYVDTGPLLERDFAARAGIGWIGRNTCVLNQQLGSWLLLGVIVTSLPVAATLTVAPDRCGSCTRCIDACPTGALLTPGDGPREMDASRCIAYLTIEKKGDIPVELREPMGRHVFGCDICQEVCPWNRRAPIAAESSLTRREELINPALQWLADLDPEGFKRHFAGSPLERTRRSRLQRNVAIAMGNSGDTAFSAKLAEWAETAEPPLQQAAAWALDKLLPSSPEQKDVPVN